MYRDIITYELAETVERDQLLSIAEQIVTDWMRKQRGFLNWEIHSNSDGSFTDIVSWVTEEDAKAAEKEMTNIPNASEWYACYKEGSIVSKNLTRISKY